MATMVSQPEHTQEATRGTQLVRWAWVCVGLTPVGWVLAVLAYYAIGGPAGSYDLPWYGGFAVWLLQLIPSAAAFVLAFLARRAQRGAGKVAALVVSGTLVTATVFANSGDLELDRTYWPAGVCVAVMLFAVFVWPGVRRSPAGA